MPPAPAKSDLPLPAVTTCTCGYDLTGLPADAAAKCPECGLVVADLEPKTPWLQRWWVMVLIGVSPVPVFWFICLIVRVVDILTSTVVMQLPPVDVVGFVMIGFIIVSSATSILASVLLTREHLRPASGFARFGLGIVLTVGFWFVNNKVFFLGAFRLLEIKF